MTTMTANDQLVVESLYREHRGTIESFLRSRCSDPATVNDIVAETFVCASHQILEGRIVTIGWLVTVARRRLIDHWRLNSRTFLTSLLANAQTVESVEGLVVLQEEIKSALLHLPNNYAAALAIRYLDDQSVSEVADALGLSYKAAESLLGRARNAFSVAFGDKTSRQH